MDKGKVTLLESPKMNTGRKRMMQGDKASSEPTKKYKQTKKSTSSSDATTTTCIAAVGDSQPRPSP